MRVKYLPQDHAARLNGGICFYKNHPYMMYIHGDGINAELRALTNTRAAGLMVELNSVELDISSPLLGYVNSGKTTYYVMRSPDRRYKQLVEPQTLVASECGITKGPTMVDTSGILLTQQGIEMLLGQYPSLKEAMELVKSKKVRAVAIDRYIALAMDSFGIVRVYYKNKEVGRIKVGNVVSVPKGELAWVVSRYLEGYDWVVE